jgi:hypothetical protein
MHPWIRDPKHKFTNQTHCLVLERINVNLSSEPGCTIISLSDIFSVTLATGLLTELVSTLGVLSFILRMLSSSSPFLLFHGGRFSLLKKKKGQFDRGGNCMVFRSLDAYLTSVFGSGYGINPGSIRSGSKRAKKTHKKS